MKAFRRLLALIFTAYLTFGPNAGRALAAVDAETLANPLDSGHGPSGAGTPASGLESFKTDLFTGRATFSVPIEVPPGTAGMQPSLALSYSSGAGNGWAGFGWTLELGQVSRRTLKGVPTYNDALDEFALNANRLVKDANGDYHTEVESFVRTRLLNPGTGSASWEVTSKDGRTLRFGSTSASRILDPQDPNKIFAWLLDRVEDAFGNFMTVTYHAAGDTGVRYPKTILYTWHSSSLGGPDDGSIDTRRRVDFCLEGDNECNHVAPFATRPDPIVSYVAGFEQKTTHRLGRIRVAMADAAGNVSPDGNGVVPTGVRWYELGYAQALSGRSRAVSITQKSASQSESLPALTFTYQDLTPEFGPQKDWDNHSTEKYFRPLKPNGKAGYTNLDMSGDGLPDRAVRIPNNDAHWNVYLNKGDGTGFEETSLSWENPSGTSNAGQYTYPREVNDTTHVWADLIDMNGDGLPDRVAMKSGDQDLAHPDSTWWHVYLNGYPNVVGFENTPLDWHNPSGTASPPAGTNYNFEPVREVWNSAGFSYTVADVVDLDGDGLVDRVASKAYASGNNWPVWWFYKGTGSGFEPAPDWVSPNAGMQGSNIDATWFDLIDMNGDGLPDMVMYTALETGYLDVYFNNGHRFQPAYQWPNPSNPTDSQPPTPTGKTYYAVRHYDANGHTIADIIDINGDGLSDRVTETKKSDWVVYYNYGMGFGPGVPWTNSSGPNPYGARQIRRVGLGIVRADVQDLDGDGLPDRPFDNTGVNNLWYVFYNNTDSEGDFLTSYKPDLLSRIDNGIGGSIEITYQPSTKYLDSNGKPASPSLPFPVQTVQKIVRKDGTESGNDIVTTYSYEGGYYEPASREFRGFREVTAQEVGGPSVVTTFRRGAVELQAEDDSLKGQVESVVVSDAGGLLSRSDTFYLLPSDPEYMDVNLYGAGGVLLALPKRVESTLFSGASSITTAVELSYDAFGNVTDRSEEGDIGSSGDERRICTTYNLSSENKAAYRVGFPSEIFTTAGAACDTAGSNPSLKLNRRQLTYHQQGGSGAIDGFWVSAKSLLIDGDNPAPGRDLKVTREPDDYGNIRSITTSPNQAAPTPSYRTTTIYYDGDQPECTVASSSTHTFPCLLVRPEVGGENLTEAYVFDPKFGNLTERIDENLHSTLMDYDALGRLIQVNFRENGQPAVVQQEITYSALAGGGDEGGTWGEILGNPGASSPQNIRTIDYAVGLASPGRSDGLEGHVYFDGLGRTIRQRTDGDDQQAVDRETTYDARGRVHETFLPHFGGDPSPGETTRQYDALGRLVTLQHPAGSCTTFDYGLLQTTAQLREASCAGTVRQKRVTRRDVHGNVVEVHEFESVTGAPFVTKYKYDALGNLIRLEDACETASAPACNSNQDHVTTITYDTLSRKLSANDPSMGLWKYKYDDVGNLIYQKDAKADVFPNEITFTYDALDRLLRKDYENPTRQDILFVYDDPSISNSQGRLTKVTDQAGTDSYEYDARGNVSRFIRDFQPFNKRFDYSYDYDNLGRLIETRYPKNQAGQVSATLSYDYTVGTVQTPFVQAITFDRGKPTEKPVVQQGTAYDAYGNLTQMEDGAIVNGNGVTTTSQYNALTGQLEAKTATGVRTWLSEAYSYDPTTGYITQIPSDWQDLIEYDALGRLKKVLGPWQPYAPLVEASYAYDALGNMSLKDDIPSLPAVSKILTYGDDRSPHAVTQMQKGDGTTTTYAYDENGNMIQRITPTMVWLFDWDQDNRLVAQRNGETGIPQRRFTYDYTGERVIADPILSAPFYMPTRDFDWIGQNANVYAFLGSLRVASLNVIFTPPAVPVGGSTIHWEPLGRATGTAAAGLWPLGLMLLLMGLGRWWIGPRRAPVRVLAYRAGIGFLVVTFLVGTSRPALAVAPPYMGHINISIYYYSDYKGSPRIVVDEAQYGQQAIYYWPYGAEYGSYHSPTVDVRHKFTSQEYEKYLGLYYYGGRWYDAELGRFISPDPFVPEPGNPQSLNRYGYVVNNPTNLVDPGGYFFGIFAAIFSFLGSVGSSVASTAGAVLTSKGVLAGAAFGATSSAIRGENPLIGAALGGIAGGIGVGVASAFGGGIEGAIVGGIAGGATAGAISASLYGGDFVQGLTYGALFGGLTGLTFGAIAQQYGNRWPISRVVLHGLAGGAISRLSGGRFEDGAILGFATAGARYLYNRIVPFDETFEKGGDAAHKGRFDLPCEGCNNVGTAGEVDPNSLWGEGGRISRPLSNIPGVNATAGLHDVFQVKLDLWGGLVARRVFNFPGMPPAAAITYTGLMADPNAAILYGINSR